MEAVALYDFHATAYYELSFKKGSILVINAEEDKKHVLFSSGKF